MLGVLLLQRGQLLWNRIARGRQPERQMLGAVLATILTLSFVVLAGLNTGQLVDRVALTDPVAAVHALPIVLAGVTALTLVTSLGSAFHHLFLAGDLELLLAAPLDSRSLFGLKVFEIWRDSLHIILFQGAALYGFGRSFDLSASYYVAAVLVGFLLTLSASALGATITLALARVRFGESILGLSRLLAIILTLPIGILGVPAVGLGRTDRTRVSLFLNQDTVNALIDELRKIGEPPAWAPSTWAAHALLGDQSAGLSLALLGVTAVVLFSGMQLAFGHMFNSGWERVRFSATHSVASKRIGWRFPGAVAPTGPVAGVLVKDWRTIFRDPRWRTGTVFTLVAVVLPAVVLFAGDPFARSGHVLRFWFGMMPVPYLAYLFGTQQGASTLVYEGRNLALLRAAPIGIARVLVAKVLGGGTIVVLVTWVTTLAVGLSHNGEPLEMVAALLVAAWLALGATVSAVASASLTADFETDNPQRRVGCIGTIVASALSILFFVANTGLVVWWVARSVFSAVPRQMVWVVPFIDWALPLLAALSVITIGVAAYLGMRRLATWEVSG